MKSKWPTYLEEGEDGGVQWLGVLEAVRQCLNSKVRVTDDDSIVVSELGCSEIIARMTGELNGPSVR